MKWPYPYSIYNSSTFSIHPHHRNSLATKSTTIWPAIKFIDAWIYFVHEHWPSTACADAHSNKFNRTTMYLDGCVLCVCVCVCLTRSSRPNVYCLYTAATRIKLRHFLPDCRRTVKSNQSFIGILAKINLFCRAKERSKLRHDENWCSQLWKCKNTRKYMATVSIGIDVREVRAHWRVHRPTFVRFYPTTMMRSIISLRANSAHKIILRAHIFY